MKSFEFTGRNIEKAIENGLKELNKSREEVDISVLSEGGFFSKSKVLITINEEAETKVEEKVCENENCGCDNCSCEECGEDCACCEEEIYELETEDGEVVPAYMLGEYKIDQKTYVAFEAVENVSDIEEGDFLAFEKVETEDGVKLENIEEEIVDKVFDICEQEMKELYESECGEKCHCHEHEEECNCKVCNHEEENCACEEKPEREYLSSEQVYEIVQDIFANIFKTLNIEAKVMILENDEAYEVKVMGDEKVASLIGYRGEGLNAYQLLINNFLSLRNKSKKIYLDVENYRNKREESLKALAIRIAKKVLKTKRKHKFEPMTAYERHIIHEELSNFSGVETHSEGNEPHRCLVVDIKRD